MKYSSNIQLGSFEICDALVIHIWRYKHIHIHVDIHIYIYIRIQCDIHRANKQETAHIQNINTKISTAISGIVILLTTLFGNIVQAPRWFWNIMLQPLFKAPGQSHPIHRTYRKTTWWIWIPIVDSCDPYSIGYHNHKLPLFTTQTTELFRMKYWPLPFSHLKMQASNNSFIATSHCFTLALALITELNTTSSITCKIPGGRGLCGEGQGTKKLA